MYQQQTEINWSVRLIAERLVSFGGSRRQENYVSTGVTLVETRAGKNTVSSYIFPLLCRDFCKKAWGKTLKTYLGTVFCLYFAATECMLQIRASKWTCDSRFNNVKHLITSHNTKYQINGSAFVNDRGTWLYWMENGYNSGTIKH